MTFYKVCPDCGSTDIIEFQDGNLWVESCDGCGITLSDTWIGPDDDEPTTSPPPNPSTNEGEL